MENCSESLLAMEMAAAECPCPNLPPHPDPLVSDSSGRPCSNASSRLDHTGASGTLDMMGTSPSALILLSITLGVIMSLAYLFCYCCRKKRKEAGGDEESLQGILGDGNSSIKDTTSVKSHNGVLLGSRTQLIRGKVPGTAGTSKTQVGSPGSSAAATPDCKTPPVQNKSLQNVKQDQHPAMAFWQNRSISLVDMYIDNTESTDSVGQINFSLEYDFDSTTLILRIIQGKDLPAKDISGTSDPYVRVTLLPDKKHRLETKIKRRTLNPRWNETLYFEGFPIQKLQSRVLHLHVFDYDRFSRDDSIGEIFLPLCQVDFSEKPSFWKALKPPAKDKCGELLVSLCYHPTNSTLTLTLLKARNLKAKDINGKSDPYVKVWLQFGDKRIEKRKTPVYKCTLNPVFNETFTFNVPWEKIRECSLDVLVMDFDNIGRNELIGRILLAGKNGTGASETKHWQDMITKPRQTVVQWHRLKPE